MRLLTLTLGVSSLVGCPLQAQDGGATTVQGLGTLTFEDGKQTQEMRIKTITYGVKMEDALFQNPDAQTSSVTP